MITNTAHVERQGTPRLVRRYFTVPISYANGNVNVNHASTFAQ
jgi:hypothetical protein